jgi:hypothetical protein
MHPQRLHFYQQLAPLLSERDSHANTASTQQVSNMSINGTTNYMSNAFILGWMETKTEGIYGHMREAMDTSDTRAKAEDALNHIKAKLGDIKTSNATPDEVRDLINQALVDFKDVPEVEKVLGAYAADLNAQADAAAASFNPDPKLAANIADLQNKLTTASGRDYGNCLNQLNALLKQQDTPMPLTISNDKIAGWTEAIKGTVDGLGKQDQLGLVNIQEFNAQLNQAKQTASSLMDAADKAASSIISHIS